MSALLSNSPTGNAVTGHVTARAEWRGAEWRVSFEDISAGTEWAIADERHAIVIHLSGAIHRLETEFAGSGATPDPPMTGELWLIPAGTRYASRARGNVVQYAELYLVPDYLTELFGEHVCVESLMPRAGHFDEFLYQSVRRLTSLLAQPDDVSQMMSQTLNQTICLHMFQEYSARKADIIRKRREPELTAGEARLLQEHISAHLDEPITLAVLSTLVQMNSHQLLRSFHQAFGTTPAQYVIIQRLRRARWLLSQTAKDITTISLETGFASHSHLSTTFKKHIGLTPHEFRLSHRRG